MVLPTPEQVAWADAEMGVIIHLDMPVFEPSYSVLEQWDYTPSPNIFNPARLDTDQWLDTAAKAGAKYAVMVAKHCSGFCLWPTNAHSYSVKSSPWRGGKGDIVGDFVKSCAKRHIKPGLYYSCGFNAFLNVNFPGIVRSGAPTEQAQYNAVILRQTEELWTNYGELFEIWFDGGVLPPGKGGPDLMPLLEQLQPGAVAFQGSEGSRSPLRWNGNERGVAPYPCWSTNDFITAENGVHERKDLCGSSTGRLWCPAESDMPNRRPQAFGCGWFWKEGEDHLLFPVDELFDCYCQSVGRNTNFLLGMAIDNRGLVPDADVAQFTAFGEKIRREFGTPLASVSGQGEHLEIRLEAPASVSKTALMEDVHQGERILSYVLEAELGGSWRQLAAGSCVGHKRIELFEPVESQAFRLRVLSAKATPQIRSFTLFR